MMRVDTQDPEKAQRLVKAGRTSGQYGQYFQSDMESAVRVYTTFKPRPDTQPPTMKGLARRFSVPYASLHDILHKACATGPYAPGQPGYEGGPLAWDDPELYSVKAGKEPIVPPEIEETIAGWFATAALNNTSEDTTQAGRILLAQMDANNMSYPDTWALTGGPNSDWWRRFFKRQEHLSPGFARMIDESRLTAHSEPAIRDWGSRIDGTSSETIEGWYGLNPMGMEKFLRESMTEFIKESGMTAEDIKKRAHALCKDPRLQGVFDQKGHALGGRGKLRVVGIKGNRKELADIPDGRWISICPLTFADGQLGFLAFVVQGSIPIEKDEQEQEKEDQEQQQEEEAEKDQENISPPVSPVSATTPVTIPAPPSARFYVDAKARLDGDKQHSSGKRKSSCGRMGALSLGRIFYGPEDTFFAATKSGYSKAYY
eukprot:COSAG05_NODE_1058_length_6003_cov_11.053862_2_plen_429_part_00